MLTSWFVEKMHFYDNYLTRQTKMKSRNIKYIPAIDHLRGYAALLIILYHGLHQFSYLERFGKSFEFNNWLPTSIIPLSLIVEGHTAVAFFMVLSGFIFTYGTYGKEIIYWRFILNRFLRTYPLFIFLIVAGIFAFPQNFSFDALSQTLLFLANAPQTLHIKSFSSMFWAVAIEWQFYLIFPFLILFCMKYGYKYLFGIIVLFTVFRILLFMEGANPRDIAYWTILGRMDQFVLGMLAAIAFLKIEIDTKKNILVFSSVFVLLIASMYIFHIKGGWLSVNVFKLFWPTWEGIIWALLIPSYIVFAKYIPTTLSRVLSNIGLLSYSFYLIHFIVISIFINHRWSYDFGVGIKFNALGNTVLFTLPIIVGISLLTYHVIEKPFLNLRVSYLKE